MSQKNLHLKPSESLMVDSGIITGKGTHFSKHGLNLTLEGDYDAIRVIASESLKGVRGVVIDLTPNAFIETPSGRITNAARSPTILKAVGQIPIIRSPSVLPDYNIEPKSPHEAFELATHRFYLGRIDNDAFAKACNELSAVSRDAAELVKSVQDKFKANRGFGALPLLQANRR